MYQLIGDKKIEGGILKQLFLQRLPSNVQLILASTNDSLPLVELAQLADRILDVHAPCVTSAVVAVPEPAVKPSVDLHQ